MGVETFLKNNMQWIVDQSGRILGYRTPDGKEYALPGQLPVQRRTTSDRKFTNIMSLIDKAQGSTGGALSNRTYHTIRRSPCGRFDQVQVVFRNYETVPVTIDAFSVAVTNTATTGAERITPSVGNTLTGDGRTGWVRGSVGGLTSGIEMPARLAADRYTETLSDWIDLPSVPPVDGSRYAYVMARAYISGTPYSYTSVNSGQVSVPDANLCHYNYVQNVAGSTSIDPKGITSPGDFTSTTFDGNTTIFGFNFKTDVRSASILLAADSIGQGQSDVNIQAASWIAYGNEILRRAGYSIDVANISWAGKTSTLYSTLAKDQLASTSAAFDYLLYSVYSPNDGTLTQTIADNQYSRAMDVCGEALRRGVVPILLFMAPNDLLDATADAIRKAQIQRCKTSDFLTCDLTPSLGNGALPERFKAGLGFDSFHPSSGATGGHAVAGAAWAQWAQENLILPRPAF